jgi:hypothetical protein
MALNNNNHSYNTCPDFKNLSYARKFNSLIIASDSRICPDKIDSLKRKPLHTKYIWAVLIKLHDSATYDDKRKSYELLKHQALKCNLSL